MSYSYPLPERNCSAAAGMVYRLFDVAIDADESHNIAVNGIAFRHVSFIQHRDRWTMVFHFDGQFVLSRKDFLLDVPFKVVEEYKVRTYSYDEDKLLVQDVIAFCVERFIPMDFSQHFMPDSQMIGLFNALHPEEFPTSSPIVE